jgi:pyrroline-5-carboxylate reductase
MSLGIVGVGAIAEAIVTGLCAGDDAPPAIHLSPRSRERSARLAGRHPSVKVAESNQDAVAAADVVLLCVRPQDAPAAVPDLVFRPEQVVISVIAGVPVEQLRRWVAPAEIVVRAIPLPAVATRGGLTATHPPNARARALFGPLGGVLELADEAAFDALAAATATLAAHLTYLDTISRWVADKGIDGADAARYVAAIFGGLSETLRDTEVHDLAELAAEFATRGGINEQFLAALRGAGTFEAVGRALDDVARRLAGG